MFSKLSVLACTLLLFIGKIHAQDGCVTDQVYQRLKSENPIIGVYEQELRDQIKASIQSGAYKKFAKTTQLSDTTTYDIPMVIHIIHDYGGEFIADNTIYTAVDYWKQVYLEQNTDTSDVIAPFKKYVGNPKIRLHLATIDPNGNPTKGVVRHQSYLTVNAGDQSKLDGWPNNEYLNLWFINAFGNANTGAAAYAYYPSSGAAMPYYDGVIGISSYINYGKAIPHEIGHVLNLQHPWGNTNNPDVACGDDEVDDTPPTKGHNPAPYDCPVADLYDTTCATNYFKVYTSSTGADSVVDYPDTTNAQNIMDYTYCQKMFTIGQAERMRNALTSSVAGRNNLYSSANLAATGALQPMPDLPPVADFYVTKGLTATGSTAERSLFLCANSSTQFVFINKSWNDTISGVQWYFSNQPAYATSTSTNLIRNTFAQPGWATVTLVATANSGSDTLVRTQAVYVADTNSLSTAGYTEKFTDAADTMSWPTFNYYNNQFKWQLYNGAGVGDQQCMRYRSYDDRVSPANKTGTPVGDHDDMMTPAFDLSNSATGDLNLNFYTAGAHTTTQTTQSAQDSMEIYVSTSCGTSWTKISTLHTADFQSTVQTTEFVPAISQWQPQTIAVPEAYRSDKTFFRFRYWPGRAGNDMYFDDFGISAYPTEVNQIISADNIFKIYPNPATAGANIVFKTGNDGKGTYLVKDITGKTIFEKEVDNQPNSIVKEYLSRTELGAAGIYFITLTINHSVTTQKLVIY